MIIKSVAAKARKERNYKGEYWEINSLFGNDWARWFALLGGREAGKSYAAMKWGVNRKFKLQDNMKFFWVRLTKAQADKLKKQGGDKFIDADIKRKYNVNTTVIGDTVYTYTPMTDKNGNEIKTNLKEFANILCCSTMYNDKGAAWYDKDFKGEYYIVLDEFEREKNEKNAFDIVYAFANTIENIVRSSKNKIRIVMIGNTLEESSDILAAFNFLPDDFGRYKLKRKQLVVDYIKPNEEYLKRRKTAAANQLIGNSSTMTNEIKIDRSLLVSKRLCTKPSYVIKFDKTQDTWFTVWNDKIIKRYNKEKVRTIPMTRYLDDIYDKENVDMIYAFNDNRMYRFTDLSVSKLFEKQLRLLKK